jgi:eukaryotic-like serine/threonine-protein kinase
MDLRAELQATLGESYSIERELGGGGMSRVFLATERALGRRVVIKVLAPELAAGVNRDRFGREILLAAQLQHPHIVPVLAAGTTGDLPYYLMPFVEGESLRAALASRGSLPPHEAVAILRDVARALAYAHGRGVVHRDIKPDNVLLSGGSAIVTDFGVAKALAEGLRPDQPEAGKEPSGPALTAIGTSLGTLAYMSPEQAAADPAVDHRADIYSFGAMAYELVSGRPPFAGLPPRELLTAIVAREPVPLESLSGDLPAPLLALIHRCLAKDPADRPQSAEEMVGQLEGSLTASGTAVTAGAPARARRTRWIVLGAGMIGLAVAGIWWSGAARTHPAVTSNSIAVLPLLRVGGSAEDDYFIDGITDELTTALSRVPSLKVTSSASTFGLKGRTDLDVRELGRQLGVGNVLTGTARRDRDRVRVTVQLASTSDGLVRWAQSYERSVTGMLAVQDEISRAIAGQLQMAFDGGPRGSTTATRDLEAWDLYLRGRFYWRQRGEAALRTAADFFAQAISRDSDFARAWAGLADALSLLPVYGPTPIDSVLPIAEHAAARAVALDSTLADAHAALGLLYKSLGRWQESQRALARAVAADSTYAAAHQWQGELYAVLGQTREAATSMRRARSLEPMSPIIAGELGYVLALDGQWDSAFAAGRRAIDLAPDLWTGYAFLGTVRLWHGDGAEARVQLERAMTLAPANPFGGALVYANALTGERAKALTDAERLAGEAGAGRASPATVAVAYAGLGDTEQALLWLTRAIDRRDAFLYSSSLYAPWFALVREDPRFPALARRMGLPADVPARPARDPV